MVAIILASVLVLGCVEEESPTKAPATQTTTQTTTQATTRATAQETQTPVTPTELNLKVGEIAKTSKIEVNVITAQKVKSYNYYSDILEENQIQKVSPGKIYILVEAEIKNVGSDRAYVGYTTFSITDSEGYKYDPTMYFGTDGMDAFKELYNNQKMKGKILFEIPENSQKVKLQYDFGNLFTETKLASWSIE